MLTKDRFKELKKGEYLITMSKNGTQRARLLATNRKGNLIRVFQAYKKDVTTCYSYSDIYKKVIGVLKPKTDKNDK